MGECLFDRNVTPDLGHNLVISAENFDISALGIITSFPLIVFSFMYQPNLPAMYQELQQRDFRNMKIILWTSTTIAVASYCLAGYFGFASFASYPDVDSIMLKQNIFMAPYDNNYWILVSQLLLIAGLILATPLSVLPCKDTVEELFLG